MGRTCTVCSHDQSHEIDQLLVSRSFSYRAIAGRYSLSKTAVAHHAKDHLPALLALAQDAQTASRADTLLDRVEALQAEAKAVLEEVKGTDNYGPRLAAIREMRHNLELIGEITKELNRTPTFNVYFTPEWQELEDVLMDALRPHKEARMDVFEALSAQQEGEQRAISAAE